MDMNPQFLFVPNKFVRDQRKTNQNGGRGLFKNSVEKMRWVQKLSFFVHIENVQAKFGMWSKNYSHLVLEFLDFLRKEV